MKVFFIYVGLPGSGKTYLAKTDQAFLDRCGYKTLLLDDLSQNGGKEALQKALSSSDEEVILLTDPHLCSEAAQLDLSSLLEKWAEENKIDNTKLQTWFYFENNSEKAIKNCKSRKDNKNISAKTIKEFSAKYSIPKDAPTIPIWTKDTK